MAGRPRRRPSASRTRGGDTYPSRGRPCGSCTGPGRGANPSWARRSGPCEARVRPWCANSIPLDARACFQSTDRQTCSVRGGRRGARKKRETSGRSEEGDAEDERGNFSMKGIRAKGCLAPLARGAKILPPTARARVSTRYCSLSLSGPLVPRPAPFLITPSAPRENGFRTPSPRPSPSTKIGTFAKNPSRISQRDACSLRRDTSSPRETLGNPPPSRDLTRSGMGHYTRLIIGNPTPTPPSFATPKKCDARV